MANSNEESKATLEQNTKTNPPGTEKNKAPKSKSNMLAIIIALGGLGTALYTLSLNQHLHSQIVDSNNQLSMHLKRIEQQQDKSQEQIELKTSNIEDARTKMQSQFDELNKQLQTAMSQRFYQNQNWLLLKARYYLELAQINAHWSSESNSVVILLQQADQLLQQFNDPKAFAIRQAIAKDIAQFQATPPVDVAGILSQLDAAQNSLNELNIPSTLTETQTGSSNQPASPKEKTSAWRLHLQDSMNLLSKLVVIRHNDENIKPLISPAFEAILKENIRLNLQEAQWAVLNHNPQVYQLVLNQALNTLKKNFNAGAQNTDALIIKIKELQQIQLNTKRPEVSTALPLLNQFISTKDSTINQPSKEEQGGNSQ